MKRQRMRRLLALFLTLAMVFTLVPGAYAQDEEENTGLTWKQVDNSAVSASIGREEVEEPEEAPLYDEDEQVRVSIVLEGEPTLAMFSLASEDGEEADAMAYREELQAYQEEAAEVISEEALDNEPLDVVWNLTLAANIISANVEYGQIEAIKSMDDIVEDVIVEQRYDILGFPVEDDPNLVISTGMTNTVNVWSGGYTGAGMRIAIIDTGLDIAHQSFDNDAFLHALEEDAAADGVAVSSYDLLDAAEIEGVLSQLNATDKMPGVTAAELYRNEKLPFGFCYVDNDLDVTHDNDKEGDHGSHVAGIAAANRYLKKGSRYVKAIEEEGVWMTGNAPDAQVLVMKVFGNGGGAYDSDYFAAIEDAILLGCDTVNLSLGSGNAGETISQKFQDIMDRLANTDTVVTISAGNSGQWAEQTSTGLPYSDDVNFHTGGSPGTYTNSLCVASVDNNGMVASGSIVVGGRAYSFTETQGPNSEPLGSLDLDKTGTEYEYVFIDGVGKPEDFAGIPVSGKVAFCSRGETSFFEKATAAAGAGAIATIVCNNAPGTISMDLSDYEGTAPAVSITQADAAKIKAASTPVEAGGKTYYTGRITVKDSTTVFPGADSYETMSDFSSWGVPGDLSMKPEITAPGGSIWSLLGTSATHDEYQTMSGTSMAAPQMAGIGALVKQYIENENLSAKPAITDRALAQSLMMSTAVPLKDAGGNYYSILNQGAGMVDTRAAVNADSYILMDASATDSWQDGKVKAELGDDPAEDGAYTVNFTINNLDGVAHGYSLSADVFTQALEYDQYGGAYLSTSTMPLDADVIWTWNGASTDGGKFYDFNGDGYVNLEDGNALLDVATGLRTRASLSHQELLADFTTGNKISSYTGYEFLQKASASSNELVVPANGSVNVSATITLNAAAASRMLDACPNGFYVEAYINAASISTAEGALGTSHSIPVLGFYGNWTDSSMFDKGSYVEYAYGLEQKAPYFYDGSNASLARNSLLVQYAGDRRNYYFGGNPYVEEDEYLPERNAMNNANGDKLAKWSFSPIRNAAASRVLIWNTANDAIYMNEDLGAVTGAFYYSGASGSGWSGIAQSLNLRWAGTDASGNPLPEGTTVELSLTLAPELYVKADGSVDWDALGNGTSQKMQVTIDNTPPVILEDNGKAPSYDAETKKLTVHAQDNQYVAAVMLVNGSGTTILAAKAPNQKTPDTAVSVELDLSDVVGETFYIQVADYANNITTYKFDRKIVADVASYYSGYERTSAKWVSYDSSASKKGTTGYGDKAIDLCAGAYAGGYVFAFDFANNFYAIDAKDSQLMGEQSFIKAYGDAFYWVSDMAYDKTANKMYLTYADEYADDSYTYALGTVDLYTGALTPIGSVEEELYALAIDDEGNFYGVGYYDGVLYKFDPDNLKNLQAVGELGVDMTDFSSLTWDSDKNQLVLAANKMDYDTDTGEMACVGSALYTIDPATAEATKLADTGAKALIGLYTPPAEEEETIPSVSTATAITLPETELTMLEGDRVGLTAIVAPWNLDNKAVTWTSSNASVATVDQNGRVTAVAVGEATITATSVATPGVSASCDITVIAIEKDLQALVWNEKGAIWWSEFNTGNLPEYTQKVECDVRQLVSATMADDGTIYAATMDTDNYASTLYRVDPSDLTTEKIADLDSGGAIFTADLAYAPSIAGGVLFGLYGSYILLLDPETGGMLGAFNYGIEDNFVAIAYAGTVHNEPNNVDIDVFYFIDSAGNIYEDGFADLGEQDIHTLMEDPLLGNTGYDTGDLAWYNSAVCAEAGGFPYLFWSQFDGGDYVNVIAIALASDDVVEVGSFEADVWPVGGLMDDNIPAFAGIASGVDYSEMEIDPNWGTECIPTLGSEEISAVREDEEETIIPGEENTTDNKAFSESKEQFDDLETLDMDVTSDSGTASVSRNGRVTVMVTLDKASTNGLIEASYDARDLELVSVNGKATLNSANTSEDGKVVLAYAYKHAAASRTTVAELVFTSRNKSDTTVTLTQKEDGTQTGLNTVTAVAVRMPADPYYPGGGGGGGSTTQPGSKPGDTTEPGDSTEPGDTTTQPPVPVVPDAAAAAEIVGQYEDLTVGSWYQEAVAYVVANNLMSGTGDGSFSPNTPMSRAMLVTVLHRAAGLPAASGSAIFSDVASGMWYSDAVDWAASSEIVGGVGNGNFNPNGNVSRQELAVILWRYAQMLGLSVATDGTTMPDFADRDQIAAWAGEAMSWAYRTGILTGDGNSLRPTDGASRVEAAAMLTRFMKLVENSRDPKM